MTVICGLLAGCGTSMDASGSGEEANHFYVENESGAHTCTMAISCTAVLDNMDQFAAKKKAFVPQDGILLAETTVAFEEGDTVYDVLTATCQKAGILMEAAYTPLYGSYYVEGINQLYEFDGGELSGWTYRVNGEYLNYGASSVKVADGDKIEWLYTCDLGRDVGNTAVGETTK
ncbi:MAG: DUF4430 domain-containing protein [Lachnospiraceae bacterium]|nr:DUF4430 domain-containing protein [Lachnospiraceae bacterium]